MKGVMIYVPTMKREIIALECKLHKVPEEAEYVCTDFDIDYCVYNNKGVYYICRED